MNDDQILKDQAEEMDVCIKHSDIILPGFYLKAYLSSYDSGKKEIWAVGYGTIAVMHWYTPEITSVDQLISLACSKLNYLIYCKQKGFANGPK